MTGATAIPEVRPATLSVTKLTGLWAFSECALGGLLHLYQVPFSGFFLAAFAVVIICCISMYSSNPFRDIMYATLVAMTVKLLISPHTPLTAYIAVAFQGLSGALICSLPVKKELKFSLFGLVALVESALQKIIIMTVLFGKSIWDAIDALIAQLLPDFGGTWSFSATLILMYAIIYAVWGIIVGLWAAQIPGFIASSNANLDQIAVPEQETGNTSNSKFKRGIWVFSALYVVALLAVSFYFPRDRIFSVLLRPFLILLAWYFLVNPLIKWLLSRAYRADRGGLQQQASRIMNELPLMRSQAKKAYFAAKSGSSGLAFIRHFIFNLIYLICLHDPAES